MACVEKFKKRKNPEDKEDDSSAIPHKCIELVWAKLRGFKWWPGVTLNSRDCRRPSAKYGNIWVFWFGDYKISEVSKHKVCGFVSCFQEMIKIPSSKSRCKAIMDVLKIIAKNAALTFTTEEDLYLWAKDGFTGLPQKQNKVFLPGLPSVVLKHIKRLDVDSEEETSDNSKGSESTSENESDACLQLVPKPSKSLDDNAKVECCDESGDSKNQSEVEDDEGLQLAILKPSLSLDDNAKDESCDESDDSGNKSEVEDGEGLQVVVLKSSKSIDDNVKDDCCDVSEDSANKSEVEDDESLLEENNQVSLAGSLSEMTMDSTEEPMDITVCSEEIDMQVEPRKDIEIVWAKLPGFKWWPAVTISQTDCRRPSAKSGNTWVFWLGDHKISQVSKQKITNFVSSFAKMNKFSKSKIYNEAVIEALKIVSETAAFTFSSEEDLYAWAKDGFPNLCDKKVSLCCLPLHVIKHLKHLAKDSEESSDESNHSENESNGVLKDSVGIHPIDSLSQRKMDLVEQSKKSTVVVEENAIQVSTRKDIKIVWAKLSGFKWWPAVTIDSTDCKRPSAKYGYTWVFWFGDYKISEVSEQNTSCFIRSFITMTKVPSPKTRDRAIIEALKIIAEEAALTFTNEDDLYLWAKDGFQNLPSKKLFILSSLPPLVLKHLKRFTEVSDEESSDETDESGSESEEESDDGLSSQYYEKLKSGEISFEKMCISCRKPDVHLVMEHPLFKGQICLQCKIMIRETAFVLGDDDKNICCAVCGKNGLLVLCENLNCPRSYCQKCLSALLSPSAFNTVMETSPWSCFFCSSNGIEDSFLQLQLDWNERLISLYFCQKPNANELNLQNFMKKKPISVLSLFDGISTGKFVLDMLGIVVDKYIACEIDPGAINVSKFHYSDSITYVGDILYISEKDIESFGHIDLVIGGSPCNDLSLVNPRRKGLFDMDGTGCLFFDFFHILNIIKKKNRNVFYLFENVAAMQVKDKTAISAFFMQEPTVVDAKYFSPQIRARYFWGNIPGLHSLTRCWKSLPSKLLKENSLYECVYETLGRKAVVSKIRTVTTQINSMYQCKKVLLPVVMDGKPDVLWVTELEKVFGFPAHYTDTGNLSITQRRKLLGRAWSVPVIKKILQPLTNFFECR